MRGSCRVFSFPVAALAVLTFTILSQMSPAGAAGPKELGKFGNWTAYSAGTGRAKICYVHAKPTKETGQYRRRGETYLQVAHRPGEKATDVVSLTAGYSYRKESEVVIEIGGARFTLFTSGDTAWARKPKTDKAMVRAMIKGRDLKARGTSSRNTQTLDNYALDGFTAARRAIGTACGVK